MDQLKLEVIKVKKLSLVLLLTCLLTVTIFAQASEWQLGVGVKEINDQYYGSLSFRPDIDLGKLGFGLSFTLNFNQNGIRVEDWQENDQFSFTKSVANIVRYVRWGRLGDPFYIRLGELNNVTVANGLLMDGYRNLNSEEIKADIRRLGVDLGLDIGYAGAHLMVNNALKPEKYALNPYIRPLYGNQYLPGFIKGISLGFIYINEVRENYSMPYAYGVDVSMPIVRPLVLYWQGAELANKARGYSVGARASFGPLYLRGEYRNFAPGFQPAIYNWQYEDVGKELFFPNVKSAGYLAEAGFQIMNDAINIGLKYENMLVGDKEPIPTLTGKAVIGPELFVATLGRKGQAEASYTQTNYIQLNDLTNARSRIDAKLSLELYRGVFGSYVYNITYDTNNTPIKFQAVEVSLGGSF